MKNALSILALLFLFGNYQIGFAQRGFKVIERAEKKIESYNYSKALKLLDKAEKMNYGFCGNAWLEARNEIDSLRFVAFFNQGKYDLARKSLDSLYSFGQRDDLDSLKVLTYQKELGNELLKKLIDESLPNSYVECGDIIDCYGIIPLSQNDMFLKFKIGETMEIYFMEENQEKKNKLWIDEFKKSKMYKMIKNIN
ncbi:hypothetical protein [Winogradskyella sp.]|uniref:hypothetical protein n=1 Tax=Winogradskyella sp. TaxID=1883156 RepID=UPI003AA9B22D